MFTVLSILDKKAVEFQMVFLAKSATVGLRMFVDALTRGEDSVMRQHPEDFALYEVGFFDEESGNLIPGGPTIVAEAEQVLQGFNAGRGDYAG